MYIRNLQKEVESLKAEIEDISSVLQDLQMYLASDKFSKDPTVQVQDILNRLPRVYLPSR